MNPTLQLPALIDLYTQGNREPEFVQRYILTLNSSGMEFQPVLDAYLDAGNMDGAKLMEDGNFELFHELFRTTDTEQFRYFRDHHANFVEKFGEKAEKKLLHNYQ